MKGNKNNNKSIIFIPSRPWSLGGGRRKNPGFRLYPLKSIQEHLKRRPQEGRIGSLVGAFFGFKTTLVKCFGTLLSKVECELAMFLWRISSVRRSHFNFGRSCGAFLLGFKGLIEDGAVHVAAVCVVFCHLLVHLGDLGINFWSRGSVQDVSSNCHSAPESWLQAFYGLSSCSG